MNGYDKDWFAVDRIDDDTYIISEYRHWEETHCYLLIGKARALLIDTGLGIRNIAEVVASLTDKPVTAIATHVHWDHIGGHRYFPDFYVHESELDWINGKFPLPINVVRDMVMDRCDAPNDFDVQRNADKSLARRRGYRPRRTGGGSGAHCRTLAGAYVFLGARPRVFVYGRFGV